jgi:sulfur-oxidizing protein SoxZ
MARAIVNIPPTVRRGETIDIRTLIAHPMETGFRTDANGKTMARNLIRRLSCEYNDVQVFAATFYAAVAANPYCVFSTVAIESGTLRVRWEGDNGFSQTESTTIVVT